VYKSIILVGICLLVAGCAKTQPPSNINQRPEVTSVGVVKATPIAATITKGQSGEAIVRLKIDNGYHVNANPPSQSYLKATEIELKPQQGISVEFITYPDPLIRTFSFSETPLKVYEGETNVKLRLAADKTATAGKHNLSAKLRVQACDDKVCYAPGAIDVIVPVNVK